MSHRLVASKFREWFTTGGMLDARRQAVGLLALLGMWTLSYYADRTLVGYLSAIPPAIVIAITCIVRAHDMREDEWDFKSVVRRIAFLLAVVASVRFTSRWLSRPGDYPDWGVIVGLWAWAGILFTTPGMPPWWKYIHGEAKAERRRKDDNRAEVVGDKTTDSEEKKDV